MTRKRRYLISAAVLVACVGIAWAVVTMLPPRPGVTKANFDRIEEGMTKADVIETIFGRPPNCTFAPHRIFGTLTHAEWRNKDDSFAWIGFDENDRVKLISRQWADSRSVESIPDKLRRWLHLPK